MNKTMMRSVQRVMDAVQKQVTKQDKQTQLAVLNVLINASSALAKSAQTTPDNGAKSKPRPRPRTPSKPIPTPRKTPAKPKNKKPDSVNMSDKDSNDTATKPPSPLI